jgi:MFS family permease
VIGSRLEDAVDESLFGGKAASLARALRAGLPAPGGFALPWQAVDAIVAGDPESLHKATALFRELGGPVAVRSSAVGEDSVEASFAGQHLTVLNVRDEESFADAVRRVHGSAATDAAIQYRERMQTGVHLRIGVVVQIMVDARSAGVLFTRDPLTGADERVIEASWGLGEAVVAGMVTPDRYRLSSHGQILERTAGHKDLEIRMGQTGAEEHAVDPDRARALCLDDAKLAALHELASRCQTAFGDAIDLEFAFDDERLYLLQSRPIVGAQKFILRERSDRRISESTVDSPASNEILRSVALLSRSGLTGETASVQPPTGLSWRRAAGFALAAILSPLNSTMIAVALPSIGLTFTADPPTLTFWLVTAYLIASIVMQSPAGKLVDVFGYSRVLTTGRLIFAAGAILGAVAPSLVLLGVSRVMMGVGGALNIPTVLAELRNEVAPEYRGRLFGIFGALMGTSAAIGPLAGGLLLREFGWHSLFLVNIPIIALSLLLEPPHRKHATRSATLRFDVLGTILFGLGIGLVVMSVLSTGTRAVIYIASGVGALVLFGLQSRRVEEPLLDMSLFRTVPFVAGSSIVGLQNFAMYAVLFLVPFLLDQRGRQSGFVGATLLAMTGAMVVGSPIGGRLSDAFGPRLTALLGAAVATAGAVTFVLVGAESGSLVPSLLMLGAGIGLATSPSQAAALSAIHGSRAGIAAGMISTMRYVGGVLGTATVGLIAARNGASHPLLWLFPIALILSALAALFLGSRRGGAMPRP